MFLGSATTAPGPYSGKYESYSHRKVASKTMPSDAARPSSPTTQPADRPQRPPHRPSTAYDRDLWSRVQTTASDSPQEPPVSTRTELILCREGNRTTLGQQMMKANWCFSSTRVLTDPYDAYPGAAIHRGIAARQDVAAILTT